MTDPLDECSRCGRMCIAEDAEYPLAVIELVKAQKAAIERVRNALEEDHWSDKDSHGLLGKYLAALDGRRWP